MRGEKFIGNPCPKGHTLRYVVGGHCVACMAARPQSLNTEQRRIYSREHRKVLKKLGKLHSKKRKRTEEQKAAMSKRQKERRAAWTEEQKEKERERQRKKRATWTDERWSISAENARRRRQSFTEEQKAKERERKRAAKLSKLIQSPHGKTSLPKHLL